MVKHVLYLNISQLLNIPNITLNEKRAHDNVDTFALSQNIFHAEARDTINSNHDKFLTILAD